MAKTKTKMVYVIRDYDGRLMDVRVYTNKETADFKKNGMLMFASKGSDPQLELCALELFEGDIDDLLATGGIGPKARRKTG